MKLFPSNNERIIFISILSFCCGIIVGLLPGLDVSSVTGAVATLIAAFAGALFAFRLNEKRENHRVQERDLAAGNRTIFNLIRAYNYIAGYNKQFIQPHKDKPVAYVAIQPSVGNSNQALKIDFDSLSFLIAKRKSEILTDLTETEELFAIFVDVMKTRNHIHANIVQPAMESAGFVQGTPITLQQIDDILGDRTATTLRNITAELIELVERGEEKTDNLISELHKIMVEIFPGKNVIKMKKLNKLLKPKPGGSA